MRPHSLRSLSALFLIVFLVATILTGVGTLLVTQRTITRLVDQRIAGENMEVSGSDHPADPARVRALITLFSQRRDKGDVGFLLTGPKGHFIAGNVRLARVPPPGYSTLSAADHIPGLTHGRAFTRDIGNGMILTTLAETEPIQNYNSARVRIYVLGFGSIILIVFGGIVLFGTLISRRIREMRQTVDAIIDGNMRQRVPVDGSRSEFDQQARAFNRMLDRIAALMDGIANVSNDIAHDLRTPLGRLRGQLARLRREADTPAMREGLDQAIAQSDALLEMFAAILRIAEIEGGDRRAAFAALDLGALATEIGEMMAPVAEAEEHRLEIGPCPTIPIHGDRRLLSQAIINLIENGVRHTPPGSTIRVRAARSGDEAMLIVEDDGPGIPAERRADALRRFGRLDKARNRSGHGLGLSLVEAIARLHRGRLALEDAGPGLRAVLAVRAD